MLIMQCCQPLVLIFQFFKIFEQTTLTPPPLSLNPGSILDNLLLIFGRKKGAFVIHEPPAQS